MITMGFMVSCVAVSLTAWLLVVFVAKANGLTVKRLMGLED